MSDQLSFIYTSDMHFDEGDVLKPRLPKGVPPYSPEWISTVKIRESLFIKHLIAESVGKVVILLGDFYCDVNLTLEFVKRLDDMKIVGFFVLGNHEFKSPYTFTHDKLNKYCKSMTSDHKYFKYLCIGIKHYFKNLCIIGDVGWTPYLDGTAYRDWCKFVESVAIKEKQVLIITHFPMKDMIQSRHSYQLFGHLHTSINKCGTHFSCPYIESQSFGCLEVFLC